MDYKAQKERDTGMNCNYKFYFSRELSDQELTR